MKKFIALLATLALSCATLAFAEDAQTTAPSTDKATTTADHHDCDCAKNKHKHKHH